MIVTLAGHVDHGKTTLVRASRALTRIVSPRKKPGLTIDLGFAYTEHLGFVDVPGRKNLFTTWLPAWHHQHALLVIAADDGPMRKPPTRRYFPCSASLRNHCAHQV